MEKNNSFTTEASFTLPMTVTVILTVLGTTACLFYLWLIFSIILSHRLRNHSNFFMASLFVGELIVILLHLTELNLNSKVYLPKILVLLLANLLNACACGYFLGSAVVAADRYYKIAKPMQYVQLMSNKVCACVVILTWGLVTVTLIGSFAADVLNSDANFLSIYDVFMSKAFLRRTVILMDVFGAPSLLIIAAFVVALARIAQKQQRKIEVERINIGNVAGDRQPAVANEVVGPRRRHSHKLVWYFCTYFATIIIAWVPNTLFMNLITLGLVSITQGTFLAKYVLNGTAIMQMALGAVFLAYVQSEHRLVLCNAWQAIIKMRC